jgi:hypothetical protein
MEVVMGMVVSMGVVVEYMVAITELEVEHMNIHRV